MLWQDVSLLALEGSMLTVLGAVQLDTKTNNVQLTDVVSFVGGGLKESLYYLKENSLWYYSWRNVVLFLAAMFLMNPLLKVLSWIGGIFTSK